MALLGSKDSYCYVCGPDNKLGLRVPFEQEGAEGSCGRYVAGQSTADGTACFMAE
jgi:hypothetical protein